MHCVLLLQLSQKEAAVEEQGGNKAVAFTAHKMHEVRADWLWLCTQGCSCGVKSACTCCSQTQPMASGLSPLVSANSSASNIFPLEMTSTCLQQWHY